MNRFAFISILHFLIILPALFAVNGCDKEVNAVENPVITPSQTSQKKYLALGDSYTIGQGVAADQRFPAQTVSLLKQSGINLKEEYIATTGWTTQDLQSAITQQNPQGPFDVVTLLIGVNDQYQRMDTTGYRIRFTQLLNKSIDLAGKRASRVVVVSIPDYSVTPFVLPTDKARISKEIADFNFINKQVSVQYNVKYLDITPSTREAVNDPSLIAADGLHPSGKEHKKWAERLSPIIRDMLH